jgi:putative transposase
MRRLLTAAFDRRREWVGRTLALTRTDDDRFTDLEILAILYAGQAGLNLADVCAAGGISERTYHAWKAKYAGLEPSAVRHGRRRERVKRRIATIAFAALTALSVAAATMLVGIPHASQSRRASADRPEQLLEARPTAAAMSVAIPVRAANLRSAAAAAEPAPPSPTVLEPSQKPNAAQPVVLSARTGPVRAPDIRTADPSGYVVQVAAVADLREARAILEQLTDAGYPAYLIAKVVDRVELYRVRVGPLKSRSEAEETVRRLEREGHRSPWVTK